MRQILLLSADAHEDIHDGSDGANRHRRPNQASRGGQEQEAAQNRIRMNQREARPQNSRQQKSSRGAGQQRKPDDREIEAKEVTQLRLNDHQGAQNLRSGTLLGDDMDLLLRGCGLDDGEPSELQDPSDRKYNLESIFSEKSERILARSAARQ